MGTASVSFARGQHLTRSCAPWWALLATLSHEARSTHSSTTDFHTWMGKKHLLFLSNRRLSHVDGEETFFVSFKPPRPGTEPRTLA